jgi:hypothetical protein
LPTASTARSVSNSTLKRGLLPRPEASSLKTRCRFRDQLPEPLPQLPLPFGTFTSLRIKAFRWLAARRPTFRLRPISVRSPKPSTISLALGPGSSFPVRYVSGGLLFLKPLGTSFTMPSNPIYVNRFVFFMAIFPQDLFIVFLDSYRNIAVHLLWKNHRSVILF